jgi:hypothetical protein
LVVTTQENGPNPVYGCALALPSGRIQMLMPTGGHWVAVVVGVEQELMGIPRALTPTRCGGLGVAVV